jgi:hypothetical protein
MRSGLSCARDDQSFAAIYEIITIGAVGTNATLLLKRPLRWTAVSVCLCLGSHPTGVIPAEDMEKPLPDGTVQVTPLGAD